MAVLRSLVFSFFILFASAQPTLEKRAPSVGGPVVMGNGFYPRAAYIKDGSLLGCFTAISGANKLIQIVRSTNNGSNWSPWGVVINEVSASHGLDNCNIHQLPNSNRIIAAFRNHLRDTTTNQYTKYVMSVRSSDDGGKTWQPLSTVTSSTVPNKGVWEPFIVDALDKSSLMLFFSRETREDGEDQNNIMVRSYDQGASWEEEKPISGTDRTSRDGMVGVARTAPGSSKLIAVFESLAPETGITSVTSSDDGNTWINRKPVYRSTVAGARHQAPQVVLVGSTLVATFQTNEDNPNASRNIPHTKIIISTDAGRTWGQKTLIHQDCEWTGATTIDSKSLLVLCNKYGTDNTIKISYSHRVAL